MLLGTRTLLIAFVVLLILVPFGIGEHRDSTTPGNLLINQVHSLSVDPGDFGVVAHGRRIVLPDDALGGPLHVHRRRPRLEDILGRITLQHRQVVSNKVSVGIASFSEADWTIAVEELLEKRGARHPHPRAGIHRPISVQHVFVKYLHSFLPREP